MDSLTHIAIGACMGEAFAGKKLGYKALLWGAVAQSFPDIDFIASFWMDTASSLLAHRGFTHSILFCTMLVPMMALLAERWHRPHNISFQKWLQFFMIAVCFHVFIDAFNNYGVGWFEPFTHYRIAFNMLYVADPFFAAPPIVAVVILCLLPKQSPWRKRTWLSAATLCGAYILLSSFNKYEADRSMRESLSKQQIPYVDYFTTPAPLQNFLWFTVARNEKGAYIGFHSRFDQDKQINFVYVPKNDSLLNQVKDHENLQKLIRFSKGFYTISNENDTLRFNDLRFGQIIGWEDPREQFVFHFYLQHPKDNTLVVQRGRFAKWNTTVAKNFMKRVIGN